MSDASDFRRTTNLLGALSVAVADRLYAKVGEATGRPRSDTAALMILSTVLDGASQESLASVLSLSQSGTARLVDRLAAAGLIERHDGPDRRTWAVNLTTAGDAAARKALGEREGAIHDVIKTLDIQQQRTLTPVLEALLAGLTSTSDEAFRICRMCDPVACGHYTGDCPVTQAAALGRCQPG